MRVEAISNEVSSFKIFVALNNSSSFHMKFLILMYLNSNWSIGYVNQSMGFTET